MTSTTLMYFWNLRRHPFAFYHCNTKSIPPSCLFLSLSINVILRTRVNMSVAAWLKVRFGISHEQILIRPYMFITYRGTSRIQYRRKYFVVSNTAMLNNFIIFCVWTHIGTKMHFIHLLFTENIGKGRGTIMLCGS